MGVEIKKRVVNWLARNPLVYSALTSEPVYSLFGMGVTRYIWSLQDPQNPETINPSSEILLGKLRTLEKVGSLFLPEQDRVFESKIASVLRNDLEEAVESGTDPNSVAKLKRTIGLMGERYLTRFLLDFVTVNFGMGALRDRYLAERDLPFFHYFAVQVNSECNARPRCPGCFAERDEGKLNYETLDRIQQEAISLGSRLTVVVGGEPLLEKDNLLKLFGKYQRTPFLLATNGILVDEAYAREVADLGNVMTFINIPGLESTTNGVRRNSQAWSCIQAAAENLKRYRATSGFISTVTQANFREVFSGKFIQQMVDFDMLLGLYFAYNDPLGCSPKTELSLTPQMQEEFSQRVSDVSSQYPIYLVNTSGGREELIGGCPAGRRWLIYVQSNGNVGGCPMVPQMNGELNVGNHSLTEILQSPYFERIRDKRPSCLRSPKFWSK